MSYFYSNYKDEKNIYTDFIRDLQSNTSIVSLKYPEKYNGESIVKLCCTQHSDVDLMNLKEKISDYKRIKITDSWCDFLFSKQLPLKEVQFCTTTPQKIFDAICFQKDIESLRFKCLKCKDIKKISNLKNLKNLFIESGDLIEDLSPLGELSNLEILILGSTTKVIDYSVIGKLKNLKVLIICSYQTRDDVINIRDISFINKLSNLEYLDLRDTRILK